MPYIDLSTNLELKKEKTELLKAKIAEVLAASFPGKTENWLMLKFRGGEDMYFGGNSSPCVMVDVSIFGAQSAENYEKMTAAVTSVISSECGVPANRVYVKYTEYENWGWNGSNF